MNKNIIGMNARKVGFVALPLALGLAACVMNFIRSGCVAVSDCRTEDVCDVERNCAESAGSEICFGVELCEDLLNQTSFLGFHKVNRNGSCLR